MTKTETKTYKLQTPAIFFCLKPKNIQFTQLLNLKDKQMEM